MKPRVHILRHGVTLCRHPARFMPVGDTWLVVDDPLLDDCAVPLCVGCQVAAGRPLPAHDIVVDLWRVILRVTYKPGVHLRVEGLTREVAIVVADYTVPDADQPGRTIRLTYTRHIPHPVVQDMLDEPACICIWFESFFFGLEEHELHEFLRVDGARARVPHPEQTTHIPENIAAVAPEARRT